jgi:phenylalanyl-tRNA synthetase beta chain
LPVTFVCELDLDAFEKKTILAEDISKFQSSKRDLSLLVSEDISYKDIRKAINSLKIDELKQFNLIDVYSDDSLKGSQSITISFVLQSKEKTLVEDEINSVMEKILVKLEKNLGIKIR